LAIAPFATAAVVLATVYACPLYRGWWGNGFCYYDVDEDVLGGWLTAIGVLAFIDFVVLGAVFLVAWSEATE
jgi:hypothetical protein